ncbi:MAG: hypothetical protein LBH19_05175 [Dysgonamonadaceae bacterium]|jgi:hypothetical protein|nr:hypothetical protein [Dysgonamonadaceae bacterium]
MTLSAKIPLNYYALNVKDRQYQNNPAHHSVYIIPQVTFSYRLSSLTSIMAAAAYNYSPATDISDFMLSYILRDYKTLYSSGLGNLTQGMRYSLRWNHKDALNGFYYNVSVSCHQRTGSRISR